MKMKKSHNIPLMLVCDVIFQLCCRTPRDVLRIILQSPIWIKSSMIEIENWKSWNWQTMLSFFDAIFEIRFTNRVTHLESNRPTRYIFIISFFLWCDFFWFNCTNTEIPAIPSTLCLLRVENVPWIIVMLVQWP